MESILLLFICLGVGVALQFAKAFPANSHQVLNQFVIHISLPALALFYIPKIQISSELLFPLGIAWIGFLLSWIFFATLGRLFGWSRKLTGCLILLSGLGNTSFVGFPIIEALYGNKGLQTAIIVDQPGSFMVMATLGITVAAMYSRGVPSAKAIAMKIAFFPPFLAFAVAILLNLIHTDFPDMLQSVFQKLGNTVTPIALVAVGLQLKLGERSKHWSFLALGLFFKLFMTPAFFLLLYKMAFDQSGLSIDVSIMEAAMAPMITASVLASSHGLKPKLSNMMIGVGIPLSFLTLAFWYWILGGI
ncbi:AEC family transporter [Flavobacterium sp. MAH-1]|uniref:AEC family transporter n=1 Tax=Flavobacterium agri TaxID=2743471 RepID=A0A7Y8Y216_9FLAO|nr:AEC family transporter [Flavobacterium agri]NUY81084.1 AEC family transporter [Flavobacterium agri]NYA71108.1 AEC family transporter [Flavobacterium agri]